MAPNDTLTINSSRELRGSKQTTGKLRLDLLPPEWIQAIGAVLTYGAKKYDDWNWAKGIPFSELLGAAKRHILAFEQDSPIDEESHCQHLTHAAVNLLMLSFYVLYDENYADFDDLQARIPIPERKGSGSEDCHAL